MTERARGSWAIVVAACTWGTWRLWLPGPGLDPAAQAALVLTVSGALAFVASRRSPRGGSSAGAPRPPGVWRWMALFGLFEAVNFLLYFAALSAGDTAAAAVTHYLAPLLVAAAAPFAGEPLSRRVALAAPIAFAGTVAMVGFGSGGPASTTAALLGAGSAVFYAANVLIAKRLSPWFGALELVAYHNLLAAPLVWAFSRTPPWTVAPRELALALCGAVVGGTLAAIVYFWGLARIAAARAAVLSYLEPLATALVGALFLGEALTFGRLVAMAVVLGAGAAVASEPAREPAPLPAAAESGGPA